MTLHRGKIARNPTILSVRALTREDLGMLKDKREQGDRSGGSIVQRLRDPHHRLARLIASGIKLGEAAARAGYSYTRASMLCSDPTFKELIDKYRTKVTEQWAEQVDTYYEQATHNMMVAERMIAEKLEEHDENGTLPPVRELVAISRDAADRFGYGKRQTNLNINADFASMLEKARDRSSKAKLIEGTATSPVASQSPMRDVTPAGPSASGSPPLRRLA